jgi:hypothetical protein
MAKIISDNRKSYSDPRFGVVKRATTIGQGKQDAATTGTQAEVAIQLPHKSLIKKFGIISAASDIVCSSSTTFELRTKAGVKLATFVPGRRAAKVTIATLVATGVAPETATTVAANQPLRVCVGTAVADSGSVFYFVDYLEQFTA